MRYGLASFELRQAGVAHQVTIALARCAAARVEGPDHQALTPAAVARGEHFWNARLVLAVFGLDIGARVAFDAEGIQERLFGTEEAHGQEDKLSRQHLPGAGHFVGHELAFFIPLPLDLYGVDFFDAPVLIADEPLGRGEINARIIAKLCGGFLLAVSEAVNFPPFRPRIVVLT